MEIQYFSHRHPLSLLKDIEDRVIDPCFVCRLPISEFAYCCWSCNFFIHSSCAKLPREVERHHFHSQHRLTLLAQPSYDGGFTCKVCGVGSDGFNYHCSECDFDLDVNCAALTPAKGKTSHVHQHLSTHPHPLIICDNKYTSMFVCFCCDLPIIKDSLIFVCLECNIILDESCVGLRQEIQHPFHPPHPLTLLSKKCECNACGKQRNGLSFHCSPCGFSLDLRCVSLVPTTNTNTEQDPKIQNVINHPHSLIHCSKTKNSLPLFCSGCLLPLDEDLQDSICVCLDCKILLHKSCASLPNEIEHPFHPIHPLTLVDMLSSGQLYECKACLKSCKGFIYKCQKCSFELDIRCALQYPPFINSKLHQHPLAFFNCKEDTMYCNYCLQPIQTPFFRCVECNFTIHLHCLWDLPPTIIHKCHLDPLTLTNPPIRDYEDEEDDSEFYCDVCEKERQLWEPTYYCKECHYVAHVHCVISEVLPALQRQTILGDKLNYMKLDIAWEELQRDPTERRNEVMDQLENYTGDGSDDSEIDYLIADPSLAAINKEIAELETQMMRLYYLRKRRAQRMLSVKERFASSTISLLTSQTWMLPSGKIEGSQSQP